MYLLYSSSQAPEGLVFVPNTEKLILLWDLKWKGKPQTNVYVASEWKIKEYRILKPL